MEKLSYPDHVKVGNNFSGVKSFSALSTPKMPVRTFLSGSRDPLSDSELNFADVFGGPPRRANEPTSTNMEQKCMNNTGEKPVFGDEIRRGILTKDFFDDIYGGKSLPEAHPKRKTEKKVGFYSVPVSRILSPTCRSPPRVSPWSPSLSVSSRIRQLSCLGKGSESPVSLINECEIPSSPPAVSAITPKEQAHMHGYNARLFVRSVEEEQNNSGDSQLPYRQSRLSRQNSLSKNHPLKMAGASGRRSESEIGMLPTHVNDGPKNLQNTSNPFHFSIHKWAGKGATLLMPSKRRDGSKDQNAKEARSSGAHKTILENVGIHSDEKPFVSDYYQDHHITAPRDLHLNRKDLHDTSKPDLPTNIDIPSPHPKEVSESQKSHLPPFFEIDLEGSGKDGLADRNMGLMHKKIQAIVVYGGGDGKKGSRVEVSETSRPIVDTINPSSEPKPLGNRVKGKVKEFIKLFNQEGYHKPKSKVDNKADKTGNKDGLSSYDEAQQTASHVRKKTEVTGGSGLVASKDQTLKIHQILKQDDENEFDMRFSMYENHSSQGNTNTNSRSAQTRSQVVHNNKVKSTDDSFQKNVSVPSSDNQKHKNLTTENRAEIQVPSSDNQKHRSLTTEIKVEVQSLDAKIKKWADGKEGNIRSLLSTLQCILGTESGWKPVPLVDIIEGTAVKRTYQKALLCLHPDKLQQRGVATHQKYIAEKVFDILQDAWKKHNDITSL